MNEKGDQCLWVKKNPEYFNKYARSFLKTKNTVGPLMNKPAAQAAGADPSR